MEEKILQNIDEIDLDKDAVIEASAGTGKTYTIKEIVKKLIEKAKAIPQEILVLTFTEKATRELKERIRQTIAESNEETMRRILMNFEDFNIFTIHGFCNKIIKNYPFEMKVPIDAELSSIPYDILLTNILLKELPDFLNIFKITNQEIEKLKQNILSLINYICFEKGHNLIYVSKEEEKKQFSSVAQVRDYILSLSFNNKLDDSGFKCLFIYYFVLRLFEEEEKYKKKNWIITYDDMIKKVWEGLNNNESFRSKMASLYKYIIIDEFQDTDLLQWKIFKTLKETNQDLKIIIVGDPKQAIYGFRGGDIHTYYNAIQELNTIKYILNKNYRSNKEIIANLNSLFSIQKDKIHWFSKNEKIEYTCVEPFPDLKDELKDRFKLIPFNAFLIKAEKAKDAYETWKSFTISEIVRLLNLGVKKSDILILCRTSSNAADYERELKSIGVRSLFYEREGSLFETKEALTVKTLLFALSFPENLNLKKILLVSEIFDLSFTEIESFLQTTEGQKFNELFMRWIELAQGKKWQELFDSVFFDTLMFEKLYKKYATNIAKEAISKYMQISSIIKGVAEEKNLNIFSLFNEFDRMSAEESAKRLNLDDEDFVKIMTIHAAKGLEASVVFLGDGFTAKQTYDFYKYYDSEKKVYNFVLKYSDSKEAKEKHKMENRAEEERLFYVALTRAKSALYFGVAQLDKNQGSYVLCGWIKDLAMAANLVKELPEFNIKKYEEKEEEIEGDKEFVNELDFSRHSFMASFSSIHKKLKNNEIIREIEISDEDEDDKSIVDEKLPTGTLFGSLIHEIMEEIDFKILENIDSPEKFCGIDSFRELIERKMRGIYEEKFYLPIMELIFFAFKNKLTDFSLCEINPEKKKNEVKFYLKVYDNLYLTGAIDLTFEHNNKYYIVDWKTNLLETYEGEDFIKKVEDSYGLQYRIYALAANEYLKNFYDDPTKYFGGIFYIYLKGLRSNSQSGIFFKNDINIQEFKEYVLSYYFRFLGKENE